MRLKKAGYFEQIPSTIPILDGKGHWLTTTSGSYYSEFLQTSIEVPAGELNDLASIPPVVRPFFPVNGRSRLAAVWHDMGYDRGGVLPEGKFSKSEIDILFYEMLVTARKDILSGYNAWEKGKLRKHEIYRELNSPKPSMHPVIASMFFQSVRLFGGRHFG